VKIAPPGPAATPSVATAFEVLDRQSLDGRNTAVAAVRVCTLSCS
jgi:hypothetical protein